MRLKTVLVVAGLISLGGCIRSVTLPSQEASLKEACYGKDRVLASRNGIAVYRCGEGDQAKYAAYQDGRLNFELNEIDAIDLAAIGHCAGSGFRKGTPEFETCTRGVSQTTRVQANVMRQSENEAAEEKRRQAVVALAALGAAAAAGAAAASQPSPIVEQPSMFAPRVSCTSRRVGNTVQTNC